MTKSSWTNQTTQVKPKLIPVSSIKSSFLMRNETSFSEREKLHANDFLWKLMASRVEEPKVTLDSAVMDTELRLEIEMKK